MGLNSKGALDLFPNWIREVSQDTDQDPMIVSFLYKHSLKWENNPELSEQLPERIKSLYSDVLEHLGKGENLKDFEKYMKYPYADALLMALFDKQSSEMIGRYRVKFPDRKSENIHSLLELSLMFGHVNFTRYLLQRAPFEILTEDYLQNVVFQILGFAAAVGQIENVRMLLSIKKESDTLPWILSKASFIQKNKNDTALHMAVSEEFKPSAECIRLLLTIKNVGDELPLLLTDDYIIGLQGTDQYMDTVLHSAAKYGYSRIVKMLAESDLCFKQFQKYWVNGFSQTPIECAKDHPDIVKYLEERIKACPFEKQNVPLDEIFL